MQAQTRANKVAAKKVLTNKAFVILKTCLAAIREYMWNATAREKYMDSEMKYCTTKA